MILFFVALSAEWWHPGDLVSWVSVGMATVVIFTLAGWCIWTARDRSSHWWFQEDPLQPSLTVVQDQDQTKSEVSYRSWLTKRTYRFVSTWFKTLEEDRSAKSERGSMQELDMRHISVSLPNGNLPNGHSQGLQVHVPGGDARVHRDTDSASSSPVGISVRQATLLSNSTGCG